MKVSVAMTTYNGEKYIHEQLLSLKNQELLPDEVIICDDGSTDGTIEIIKRFIEENKLAQSWSLIINDKNKGYSKNFLDCAERTSGNIIFFSDQDDVWDYKKIKLMKSVFESNPNVEVVSCTFSVINEYGEEINSLYNKARFGNGKLKKVKFTTQIKTNYSVGLTLAVRRNSFCSYKPIIERNNLPYDVPIGLFASINEGYYNLGIPLVKRRVHSCNISQPKYTLKSRLLNVEKHIEGREGRLDLYETCLVEFENQISIDDKRNLIDALERLRKSILFLKQRNRLGLFFDLFSINPMINKLIAATNFVCAIFGDYSTYNRMKEK